VKTKIAFTSCARYQAFPEQPQWQDIERENPDYLFLLGDQIYMDFGIVGKERNGAPERYPLEKFTRVMDGHYRNQWNEPNFKRLFEKMKAKNAVFGVWDDHDFAWNNACGNDVKDCIKNASRELFHKWMDCSTNRPEVYCHIDIPHARVIFLDTRFYADGKKTSPRQLLGEEQFRFLEEKLNHDLPYTFICSGLTLENGTENCSKFKDDYNRLTSLIRNRKNVVFLAGDIHNNKFTPPDADRPCYEIVASGIAVNKLGLPWKIDDRRNWGLLEVDENEIAVRLVDKKGDERFLIPRDDLNMAGAGAYNK